MYLIIFLIIFSISNGQLSLNGAGATFPSLAYYYLAENYYKETNLEINYQAVGSGEGIKRFFKEESDFCGTDEPLSKENLIKNNLIQFPTFFSAVVPVANIPELSKSSLVLNSTILAKIYLKKITNWNDPEIIKLNPNIPLPSKKIITVQRQDGSGTTFIFTSFLAEESDEFKAEIGVGKTVKWKNGLEAKGNSGIATLLEHTPYSISYLELNHANASTLLLISMINKSGFKVKASKKSIVSVIKSINWDKVENFNAHLLNSANNQAWPIVSTTYIILSLDRENAYYGSRDFFRWCLELKAEKIDELGFVNLPLELKYKVLESLEKRERTSNSSIVKADK